VGLIGTRAITKMRFDGLVFWGSIAIVSFRLSNLTFCRAGIAGFACLALVGACRGGEGARNIEVVPLHGTSMDTNFDEAIPADTETMKEWAPLAPRRIQPQLNGKSGLPLPRPQTSVSTERERELLDRRKNWVFMTPEDYAAPDGKNDGVEKNGSDKKSGSVIERYFQRLNDSGQAAMTNQFNALDSDRLKGQTNLLGGNLRPVEGGTFGDSPFDTTPNPGVFDSVRRTGFAGVFGSAGSSAALPTPEDVRLQAEQKAHIESYKKIWDIDQPAPAPVAPASASASVDSGPLFGMAPSGIQSASPVSAFAGSSSSSSQPVTPAPSPVTTQRAMRPPRSDFSTPQRPF
jgi:hypothetical protein